MKLRLDLLSTSCRQRTGSMVVPSGFGIDIFSNPLLVTKRSIDSESFSLSEQRSSSHAKRRKDRLRCLSWSYQPFADLPEHVTGFLELCFFQGNKEEGRDTPLPKPETFLCFGQAQPSPPQFGRPDCSSKVSPAD